MNLSEWLGVAGGFAAIVACWARAAGAGDSPAATNVDDPRLVRARRWLGSCGGDKYAGWIAYRLFRAEEALACGAGDSQQAAAELSSLAKALDEIAGDPLTKMRGVCEWAYRSAVDGSGQPFTICLPNSYDPRRAYPLTVSLHGYGGTHSKDQDYGSGHPDERFILRLLGRAPAGGYVGLCEIDVLESIAYVCAQWNIDRDRIHLDGSSMGGRGTFHLGSRHPDLFASAFLRCGYAADLPVTNMRNLPTFSLHSDDDWTVPILQSRLPLAELRKAGGEVIQWEATGYGHPVNSFQEAMADGRAFVSLQRRKTAVRRIVYAATDEAARGSYWAEVVEWGSESSPATFDLRVGDDNSLWAELDNVAALAVKLMKSPADRGQDMRVVVNAMTRATLSAPLPEELFLRRDGEAWAVSTQPPPTGGPRRHFPGGLPAMYHGEPLLVVWGTRGSPAATDSLRALAEKARRAPSPDWQAGDEKEATIRRMLYARLPAKADVDVTDADLAACNLILLGTAEQNAAVARMAAELPVAVAGGKIRCDDGPSCAFAGRAMGLLHYNPLAPDRLVYWLAVEDFTSPKAGLELVRRQSHGPAAADFLVTTAEDGRFVAQRCVGSDWSWQDGYGKSGPLPQHLHTPAGWQSFLADVLREATAADAALLPADAALPYVPQEVRWMDLTAWARDERLAIFHTSGSELAEDLRRADGTQAEDDAPADWTLVGLDGEALVPERLYLIACQSGAELAEWTRRTRRTPASAELAAITWRAALAAQLARHAELGR
jgi:hypothetical protein